MNSAILDVQELEFWNLCSWFGINELAWWNCNFRVCFAFLIGQCLGLLFSNYLITSDSVPRCTKSQVTLIINIPFSII